jgi:hypothetical protein
VAVNSSRNATESHNSREDAINVWIEAQAHHDASYQVDDDDYRRRRACFHRFRRATAKRNGGFRAIETSPPQFNPPRDPRRRGGALGITSELRVACNAGDGTWPELGFW